jgi:hypothetical protein
MRTIGNPTSSPTTRPQTFAEHTAEALALIHDHVGGDDDAD